MSSEKTLTEVVSLLTARFADAQIDGVREAGLADLSLSQFVYLEHIARIGNPTPTGLAKAQGVSKPTVSVAIDRLESAGYIRKTHSDEDRRSYHLHLTEKGELFSKVHADIHRAVARTLIAGLNKTEIARLTALMAKVLRHLRADESRRRAS